MTDTFVSLAQWLCVEPDDANAEHVEVSAEATEANTVSPERSECDDLLDDVMCTLRRFRAALADALEVRLATVLRDLAVDVLARELRLAPVDIRAVVARTLERTGETPLTIRAHPDECAALTTCDAAVVADSALRRGDIVVEVRSGTIDASFGARTERVLHAMGVA